MRRSPERPPLPLGEGWGEGNLAKPRKSPHPNPLPKGEGTADRRGVAILVVLVVISVAFALSYAIMRSQGTALLIQQNAHLGASARQAAMTGLTAALKKMHTDEWAGVDTTLSGSLGSHEGFEVTYTTGDPSLESGDDDYAEYPYRVTLLSTGYAADPGDPQRVVTHQMRAVVRLVPRKLADEPTDWATMQESTVHQSKKENFEVDIPCQFQGRVRVQGKLKIGAHYPNDGEAWWRYLRDLRLMRSAGYPDCRPFTGPVYLPYSEQDAFHLLALTFALGVTANNAPLQEAASDWVKPTSLTSYQIYPGGPAYEIPELGDALENVTLKPDPASNPLGIFYRDGSITIRTNVTIRGSLFCKDDITIEGEGVRFEPVELPGLSGSDVPLRLPVVSCRNFTVKSTGGGSVAGLAAVFDEFKIEKGPETAQFSLTGRLITRKLYVKEREPWKDLDWEGCYDDFEDQLHDDPSVPYFPIWMAGRGRDPTPLLTIQPDSDPFTYHWHNWYDPIFVPHPDDATELDPDHPGLRWELIQWTDNP